MLIAEYLAKHNNIHVVQECNDGFEGLKAIQNHEPDLVFLDIQMPKITGFEMLELLDNPPSIIFTTAFDEYAIKAFEANAIDYLLKPFSKERFDKAIDKWMVLFEKNSLQKPSSGFEKTFSNLNEMNNRVVVKTNVGIKIIPITEITYLEAYDDYVKIFTKDANYIKKNTLSHYEQSLSPNDFVRVHRSYIVSITQITRIENPEKDTHVALLKNGIKIPLSRAGYSKLKLVLGI